MNIITGIRKLARSVYWQQKFKLSSSNIVGLFGTHDISQLQLFFIHWIETYKNLFDRLSEGTEYLTLDVIEDDERTDAFLVYFADKVKKDKVDSQSKKLKKQK